MATSPSPGPHVVRFGVYDADLSAGELRKQGVRIRLPEQPFQLLAILLERPGEVVTREDLQKRLWPDGIFVDVEQGLNAAVKRLRDVLGDSSETPRYIETLPRHGYRFIGSVNSTKSHGGATEIAASIETQSAHSSRYRQIAIAAAAVVAAAAALLALDLGGVRSRLFSRVNVPAIHSLVVLPLTSLSNDPSQEYFADGMTDALITELSQIGALKVTSRTTAMHYKKLDKTSPQIARELGVTGLIEGTVQRAGDRVRISVQLIYGPADKHLWANSYERDLRDVLALEREMARGIAKEIEVKLTPQEQARLAQARPVNLKALEAYLQGKYHLDEVEKLQYVSGKENTQQEELDLARNFFQRAIDLDPNYAASHVGLSKTWFEAPVTEGGPEKTRAALEKALELEPDLAEAHLWLAQLEHLREWNWSAAEREFKRAIELNPSSGDAHASYMGFLDTMGRFEEGMREFSRVQELDPGHYPPTPNPFFERRQYDKAIEMDRNDIDRHAFGFLPHWDLAINYEAKGMHDDSVKEWEQLYRMLGYEDVANAMHRAFERSGYRGAYREWARELEEFAARDKRIDRWMPAMAYAWLGEKDRAFFWLEKAYENRETAVPGLRVDPLWDNLRSDPRFNDLLRRVGMPQ